MGDKLPNFDKKLHSSQGFSYVVARIAADKQKNFLCIGPCLPVLALSRYDSQIKENEPTGSAIQLVDKTV
jgi:hypothetical protein